MNPTLSAADIEAIERATCAAVPPERLHELPGWLLPIDHGTVGRAHSAVPTSHAPVPHPQSHIDAVQAIYGQAGLQAVWRVAQVDAMGALQVALRQRGYQPSQPTAVQIGHTQRLGPPADLGPVTVQRAPSPQWAKVYMGPGFDPIDATHRVRILGRGQHTWYATLSQNGEAVAAGALSCSHGWASIHGMRTAAHARRQGLAQHIIKALAQEARRHMGGDCPIFLQVEAHNTAALALYAKCGFATAWVYGYWRIKKLNFFA